MDYHPGLSLILCEPLGFMDFLIGFSIDGLPQRQYDKRKMWGESMQEYSIQDTSGIRAVILPEKGATVISLCKDGRQFLYSDPENLSSPERPRCGIPFLFPIFGRLQDGKYTWDGTEYAMEIHGFGHTSRWKVAAHTDTVLRLVLDANEDTLMQYPFRFRVTLEFALEQGALTIHQIYENLDEKPMPYNYGFHPYFRTEKLENLHVETNADTFYDFAVGGKAFGHGSVSLSMPEGAPETGAAFMGVRGPTILHNDTERKRLTMEFDESFHTHVLWSQAGKKFLCVEPVNGSANGLNTGVYLTLQPGESKTAFLRLRPEIM
jgi:galactose mutarotase-like enzyme